MFDNSNATQRISAWENNNAHTPYDPLRTQQTAQTPSMRTSNYLMPSSKYASQIRPPLSIDERQTQQYQQPTYLSQKTPENFQPTPDKASKTSILKTLKNHITVVQIAGLIVGLILTGIPLVVMITLYVQPVTSTSTVTATGANGVTTSIANSLPYQCTSYTTNSDSTRNVGYSSCNGCYCDSFSGWYQFTGSAGTRLATFPVSTGYCGASYTGWFNGTLPSTTGATNIGTVCVNNGNNICYSLYSISSVLVTNCNGFYVFYLTPFSYCTTRYCTV